MVSIHIMKNFLIIRNNNTGYRMDESGKFMQSERSQA